MRDTTTDARVSRRDALRTVAVGMAALVVGRTAAELPRPEAEFAPTDEYPFFGYEPAERND